MPLVQPMQQTKLHCLVRLLMSGQWSVKRDKTDSMKTLLLLLNQKRRCVLVYAEINIITM